MFSIDIDLYLVVCFWDSILLPNLALNSHWSLLLQHGNHHSWLNRFKFHVITFLFNHELLCYVIVCSIFSGDIVHLKTSPGAGKVTVKIASFQHPHDGSQPSLILVSGDLMTFSGLLEPQVCLQCAYIHVNKTHKTFRF